MKVKQLTLKNFRNIRESTLHPDPSINFLVGSNGAGKTSYLEALGILSMLRSFRDSKTSHLIRWGVLKSELSCTLSSESSDQCNWETFLKVAIQTEDSFRQKTTKMAFVNEKPFRSSTQYLSQRFGNYELGFHTVIFNPADHDLVRSDPGTRRAYLDRVIAAEDLQYLRDLQKYQRVLDQRNSLLKSTEKISREVLIGFTESLCQYSISLTHKRLQWIERLATLLNSILHQIAPKQSTLRLAYISNWVPTIEGLSFNNNNLNSVHFAGQGQLASLELLEQSFWIKISALEAAEHRAGHSLVGPHRDDWVFFMDDQLLKGHGSQGEVRSALLALKLCEIMLFRNETGHRPLLLLDDFSSELDQERRQFLLRFLMETDLQAFVTTTEDSFFVGKRYWVSNGMIEEGRHDDRTTPLK